MIKETWVITTNLLFQGLLMGLALDLLKMVLKFWHSQWSVLGHASNEQPLPERIIHITDHWPFDEVIFKYGSSLYFEYKGRSSALSATFLSSWIFVIKVSREGKLACYIPSKLFKDRMARTGLWARGKRL